MRRNHLPVVAAAVGLAVALLVPSAARAQHKGTFTASLMGGIGGSLDRSGAGFSNTSYQLGFAMAVNTDTSIGLRLGTIDFGTGGVLSGQTDLDLTYATVAAEYRFVDKYYESGLFIGLGSYRLESLLLGGGPLTESSVGVTIGSTGEFEISRQLSVLVEATAHFVDLAPADIFATVHAGLVYHF